MPLACGFGDERSKCEVPKCVAYCSSYLYIEYTFRAWCVLSSQFVELSLCFGKCKLVCLSVRMAYICEQFPMVDILGRYILYWYDLFDPYGPYILKHTTLASEQHGVPFLATSPKLCPKNPWGIHAYIHPTLIYEHLGSSTAPSIVVALHFSTTCTNSITRHFVSSPWVGSQYLFDFPPLLGHYYYCFSYSRTSSRPCRAYE